MASIPHATRWALCVLLAVVLAGVVRMRWVSRTGSEEFASSLHALDMATLGVIIDRRTIADSDPSTQFRFWNSEIQRILQEHPRDAELHAAAALMLDRPCMQLFASRISREVFEEAQSSWAVGNELFDRLNMAQAEFDLRGPMQACKWIERATELEPDEPRWWRLRAILLWPPVNRKHKQRVKDWRVVLEQARQHDPDNALYDILEARELSRSVLELDVSTDRFVIADDGVVQQMMAAVRASVEKDRLTLGEPAVDGLARLHRLSRHSTMHTLESIRARFTASRVDVVVAMTVRQILRMSKDLTVESDREKHLEWLRLAESLLDLERDRSDPAVKYGNIHHHVRIIVCQARVDLLKAEGTDSKAANDQLREAARWRTATTVASTKWTDQKLATASPVQTTASSISLSLLAGYLGLSVLAAFVWLVLSRDFVALRLSCWPWLVTFAGIGVSYFFLGVGAAGVVSEHTQHWCLTGLSLGTLVTLLSGAAVRTQYRLRFGIRSLLIASTIVAVVLQVAFHWQLGWSAIGLPVSIHAESDPMIRMTQSIPWAASLDGWLPGPAWVSDSMVQWLAKEGPANSIAISLVFTLIVWVWRMPVTRTIGEGFVGVLVIGLVLAAIWVWLEPSNYRVTRSTQIPIEIYLRSIDDYYAPFELLLESELLGRQIDDH